MVMCEVRMKEEGTRGKENVIRGGREERKVLRK